MDETNKIVRVILCYDYFDEEVSSIIVVRENGKMDKYSDKEKIQENYNRVLTEMKKTYAEDLEGLDNDAISSKLVELGKIKQVDKDELIEKIEYFPEESKIVIYLGNENYDYSGVETYTYSEEDSKILVTYGDLELMPKEDVSPEDFKKFYIEKCQEISELYGIDADSLDDYGLREVKYAKKNIFSKIKNIRVTKKMVSLVTAGALIVGVGIGGFKLGQRSNSKNQTQDGMEEDYEGAIDNFDDYPMEEEITPLPQTATEVPITIAPTVVPTAIPTPTPTIEPTLAPTAVPTVQPTATPTLSLEEVGQPDIWFTPKEEDPYSPELVVELNKDFQMSYNYGDGSAYDDINYLCQVDFQDMDVLASHIQSPTEVSLNETTGRMIYFEKFFADKEERAFVDYFSDLRNEIIWQGYREGNLDMARQYINVANYETVRCIRDLKPVLVTIDGEPRYVSYNGLSQNGKYLVLNICNSMRNTLTTDNFEYQGEVFDINAVAEVLENASNNLMNNPTK